MPEPIKLRYPNGFLCKDCGGEPAWLLPIDSVHLDALCIACAEQRGWLWDAVARTWLKAATPGL